MKSMFTLAALVAFVLSSFSAVDAQETSAEKCTKCPASSTTTVAKTSTDEKTCCDKEGSCSTCPVSIAMAKLPKMTYKVGTEATCCSKAAGEMAKKASAPIHYVVGKKVFEEKEKAYVSLVESTEAMVKEFMTPKKCEKSGTTTIAGESCGCSVMAGKKAELVKAAADKVTVSYKVGKETCNCPTHAGELAKKSGEKMTYVVAGEETCCSMTARLNTARAKYKAAVQALVAATPKTETKTETKTKG